MKKNQESKVPSLSVNCIYGLKFYFDAKESSIEIFKPQT